jgi:molybdate transport system ATP-binding protein
MMLDVDARLQRGAFGLAATFQTPLDGITALFGPSGAGKSMVLSAIAGLAKLEGGHVVVAGERLTDVAANLFAPPHQRGIGMVFQDGRLFPHLSVRGNLAYAAVRAGRGALLHSIAEQVGCAALLERPVRNLSGGEQSRVALARALLSAPKLLLLDEPFAALDGATRMAFLDLLRDVHVRQGLPMLVVTHQIDDLAVLADHVVALRHGGVVACGPAAGTAATSAFQALLSPRDTGAVIAARALKGALQRPSGAVWLRADHVLIAVQRPIGLSARNVWQGEIIDLQQEETGAILARIQTGDGLVLSRVTQEAAGELSLRQGSSVWAVIKAHSS